VPRASRKDRKLQRKRATNATDRGLPASELELRSSATRYLGSNPPELTDDASSNASPGSSKSASGLFSTWPLSMKILGLVAVATLALLGFSLWRTVAGTNGSSSDTAPMHPAATQTGAGSR
jgi:hypothetical protein